MEISTDNIYKPVEPKTLAYDYLFNYFGKDTFKGKVIAGACIQLAIKAYKGGKEVKFTEEPCYNGIYLCSVYQVCFDRDSLFRIEKRMKKDDILRIAFGWDCIKAEIAGYTLDYFDLLPDEIRKDLPEQLKDFPSSTPMEVTEEEFKSFLISHIDEFDITDNINAQVPSVSYI